MSHDVPVDAARPDAKPTRATTRLGTTLSRRAALDAATRVYLAGQTLDMSTLADELGVGRSTLYRWVGNREDLLGAVLAEATVRTFRKVARSTRGQRGYDRVLDVCERFMHAIVDAPPLQALTKREPLLFLRVALMPGQVEAASAQMITELLEAEEAAGHLTLPLPPAVLGLAIVRLCDAHLYANLLGNDKPEIGTALQLVAALLSSSRPAARPGADDRA
jgi:AcrR family transcriptional regulator